MFVPLKPENYWTDQANFVMSRIICGSPRKVQEVKTNVLGSTYENKMFKVVQSLPGQLVKNKIVCQSVRNSLARLTYKKHHMAVILILKSKGL